MGVESQESRNVPRNRKCGNCRFYEPAPLWRKGWCRNPKLYPPHANHLVDATSIDCEGGFRSRIYWEALPVSDEQTVANLINSDVPTVPSPVYQVKARPIEQTPPVVAQTPEATPRVKLPKFDRMPKFTESTEIEPVAAEVKMETPNPNSRSHKPEPEPEFTTLEPDADYDAEPQPARIVRTPRPPHEPRREPSRRVIVPDNAESDQDYDYNQQPEGDVPQEGDWRNNLRQRLPFTQKLPLERVNISNQNIVPWAIVGILTLVIVVVLAGNLFKKSDTAPTNQQVASATRTVATSATSSASSVKVGSVSDAGTSTTVKATDDVPTATPPPPAKTGIKMAQVKGTDSSPLNVREDPNVKAKLVTKVNEGEKVTILEGPTDSDGRSWYKIEYGGKTGWAVKDYLVLDS